MKAGGGRKGEQRPLMAFPNDCNIPLDSHVEGRDAAHQKRQGSVEGFNGGACGWDALVESGCGADAQGVGDQHDGQPKEPRRDTTASHGGGIWLGERAVLVHERRLVRQAGAAKGIWRRT